MEGISNLSQALSIDPTSDVRILALMWRLGACSKPGQISLSEFETGMQRLGCESVESLVPVTPSLDPGFLERAEFREFYKFVFQARARVRARACARALSPRALVPWRALDASVSRAQFNREGTHRTIEKDVIAALLPLAIGDRSQHLAPSVEFLEQCGSGMKLRPPASLPQVRRVPRAVQHDAHHARPVVVVRRLLGEGRPARVGLRGVRGGRRVAAPARRVRRVLQSQERHEVSARARAPRAPALSGALGAERGARARAPSCAPRSSRAHRRAPRRVGAL